MHKHVHMDANVIIEYERSDTQALNYSSSGGLAWWLRFDLLANAEHALQHTATL